MGENYFSFLTPVPTALTHAVYCGRCYDDKVAYARQEYDLQMEKARDVFVYYKGQGEETRLFKRNEDPLKVSDLTDRSEVVMRLAFQAVQNGFNTLVDVEVKSEKVRSGAYQTTKWSGVGTPTNADAEKIYRRDGKPKR